MAEKVGKKTGKTTSAGRDVYITPEGENVSEKSVTIKFDDNSYVNAPSIHDGIRYSEDAVRQMLLDGKIKPTSRHDTLEEALDAAKSRSASLMSDGGMARQMQAIQEARDIDEGVDTRTKEEMLADQMSDLKSIGKTIKEEGPMFIAESTPGVGEAIAAKRTSDAIDEGDYVGAAIEGTAGALGLVPIIGDAASKGLRKAAKAVRKGYNPEDPASRVFHLTKKDFDTADVIGSGTSDIGFHVGTAAQANARGSTNIKYDKDLAEQMVKDERILPMVLKENLKPARIPDVSSFKEPMRWIGDMSVAKSDRQRIKFLLGEQADADLLAKAPRVTVGGDTYFMLPDVMRMGMDEKLWKDIILQAHRAKRIGLDTINNQKDRVEWFNTLKQTANKHGYDSFVYKNEYEGTDEQSLDALVEQIQKASRGEIDPSAIDMNSRFADSYMLLEPDQAKGLFGGMTEGDPRYMKNKGGLMLQEGGAVPMKEQMEMFEDGGLKDEGGEVDPVSGNDVPPGSTKEEVRDDIPAQLSEGEFVFPADVVRYIGLEKLMRMRQEAKMGLKMMEEMGQMGNSDEATIPDDLPFSITDLIIIDSEDEEEYNDEKEMAEGGLIKAQQGTFIPATEQQKQFGISGMQAASAPTTGFVQPPVQAASAQFLPSSRPTQQAAPTIQIPETLPKYEEYVASTQAPQTITIVNKETGEKRMLTYIPGVTQIPAGFVREEDYIPQEVVPETTTVGTTQVTKEEGDGDAERQRREEEMYGPGGGRLSVGDDIFGVSFDGINPLTEGRGLIAGLAFGGKIPEKLVNDVTVNFKRGDLEFAVSGEDYNTLKDIIQNAEGGSGGPAATQKIKELQRKAAKIEAEKRNAEELDRMKELAKTKEMQELVEKARQTAAVKEAEQKRKESLANAANKQQYQSSVYDKPEGDGPQVGGAGVSRDVREAIAEAGGYTGGGKYGGFAEGGLASKPKPKKTKKMKRGGLASK